MKKTIWERCLDVVARILVFLWIAGFLLSAVYWFSPPCGEVRRWMEENVPGYASDWYTD